MSRRPVVLGGADGYTQGEIPEPWLHDWDDFDGGPIDLSGGYTAKLSYKIRHVGTQVIRDATLVNGPEGRVGMVWVNSDFATAGWMQGELVVGNGGVQRYAKCFVCKIVEPLGGPLPAI